MLDSLFKIWKYNSNKTIMSHINIIFLRNKIDKLTSSATEYTDALMISGAKLYDTFLHD